LSLNIENLKDGSPPWTRDIFLLDIVVGDQCIAQAKLVKLTEQKALFCIIYVIEILLFN
jgi:hypothetical protein